MKILLGFLLALALVQGRDYCEGGKFCTADWQCKQELGFGFSFPYGYCCYGRCTITTNYVSRGSFCNTSDPCAGQCSSGDNCVNNVCVGDARVTPGCSCTTSADCISPTVDGESVQTSCVNGTCMMLLPRDAACSANSQCYSNACYQGKCLGEDLDFGDSCRLSQECESYYQCMNGKCTYKTEGMACEPFSYGSCDPSKYFCNSTSSKCQTLVPLGGYCTGSYDCISSAFCNTTATTCVTKAKEGESCDGSKPCATGLSCMNMNFGVRKCVKYYSVPDHGYCTSSIQCKGYDSTCAREGANDTARFCVPDHSIKAGGNCSVDISCPMYGMCNTSTDTCTGSYLGKSCDSNSSSTDKAQCALSSMECACNDECEVGNSIPYCGGYEAAPGDPTKMNDADRKSTANAACCNFCFNGQANTLRTSLTGFQINCKTLSITMMPVCNITSGGGPLLLHCDEWSGVSLGSTTNLSVIFFLIASLLAYFQ